MNCFRFLIIENDSNQRELLECSIRRLGFSEIISFECITSAYSWLQANGAVDILICDLDLASTSLVFLKKISERFDIGGVAFFSKVDLELRRSIARIVELLGMKYLGDLRASTLEFSLKEMVHIYNLKTNNRLVSIKSNEQINSKIFSSYNDLKQAVENKEFVGYFQPKYFLNSMGISGAEVLLRWNHPVHGIIAPDVFIDKLIENNFLDDVFLSLFKQGIKLQKNYLENHNFQLPLSFNLDVTQLNSTIFVRRLIDIVRNSNVKTNLITFEITEKNLSNNPALLLKNLVRLRVLGFELAIDDFGSAYSSLFRLCDFPFTQIKLDKNFIGNVCVEPKYKMSLISILSLASMMNMSLVVEGVESEDQFKVLRNLGCLEGQGYFFCNALSEFDFIMKIKASEIDLAKKSYLKKISYA